MTRTIICSFVLAFLCTSAAFAVDHKVAPLKEPPPEGLSAEVAARLASNGFKVLRGENVLCSVWLCKEWSGAADFKPTTEVLYPFQQGELIGVVKYARKGSDFRDQDISAGLYTLRYAHQPVDGNHVGTSPTRDFLLLTKAAKDTSPEPVDFKKLAKASADAAGSSHPALLSMQRVEGSDASLGIRHNDEHDWWIVRFSGTTKGGGQGKPLAVELIVVGKAAE
jgi:hypothetical protein